MNWKNINWLRRGPKNKGDVNEASDAYLTSKPDQGRLCKRQLKEVSDRLGETRIKRLFNNVLYSKTCYLVFESPRACLSELSGNAVSELSRSGDEGADGVTDGEGGAIRVPRWYVEGSTLYLSMHFESDAYAESDCFEKYITCLTSALKPQHSGKRVGGAIVYLHQHDLVDGHSASWLNRMAALVNSASAKARESIPVYLIIEGVSGSGIEPSCSVLNAPIGMLRDNETVSVENFSQWFSQSSNEITSRLLRKTLKEVQYVHNITSRRIAFLALSDARERLSLLNRVAEDFNHRWHFSSVPVKPSIRGLFLATEGPSRNSFNVNPSIDSSVHYRWWQKFSCLLVNDQYGGFSDNARQKSSRWLFTAGSAAVSLVLILGMLHSWSDYRQAKQLGITLVDKLHSYQQYGAESDFIDHYGLTLTQLAELEVIHDELKQAQQGVSVFTKKVALTGAKESQKQQDRIIQGEFGKHLDAELIAAINQNDDFEMLYSALKGYLYLHLLREGRSEYLMWWFGREWQGKYKEDTALRQQLAEKLSAFIDGQTNVAPIDENLVNIARVELQATPLYKRLYLDIKQQVDERTLSASDFNEIIGYSNAKLFGGDVQTPSRLYTAKGYQNFFLPFLKKALAQSSSDHWVLGQEGSESQSLLEVEAGIYRLYIEDYLSSWNRLLNSLKINPTESLHDMRKAVKTGVGDDGAIRRTLQYIYDNTAVFNPLSEHNINGLVGSLPPIAAAMTSGVMTHASALSENGGGDKSPYPVVSHPMKAVALHFERLNSALQKTVNNRSAIEQLAHDLTKLGSYLADLDLSGRRNTEVFEAIVKKVNGHRNDPVSQILVSSKNMPEPLDRWVSDISRQTLNHMVSNARRLVRAAYNRELYGIYASNLKSRYPLATGSDNDIEMDHFTDYFKPEGQEMKFFSRYVKPFVTDNGNTLYEKKIDGVKLGFSAGYLSQLKVAQNIRGALFDEKTLSASVQLRPIYLDANISRFDLNLMNDHLHYRHGPQTESKIRWPSTSGVSDIVMTFEDYNGQQKKAVFTGEWSLFRFIKQYGKEQMPGGRRYRMSLEVEGQRAVYEVIGKPLTPDLLKQLSTYQLPRNPLI